MWIQRRLSARGLVGARPSVAPVRILALGLCLGILSGSGCASRTPEWAESIDPCCGQDEVLAGMEPSESRCADFVVSREAALALAWSADAQGMSPAMSVAAIALAGVAMMAASSRRIA